MTTRHHPPATWRAARSISSWLPWLRGRRGSTRIRRRPSSCRPTTNLVVLRRRRHPLVSSWSTATTIRRIFGGFSAAFHPQQGSMRSLVPLLLPPGPAPHPNGMLMKRSTTPCWIDGRRLDPPPPTPTISLPIRTSTLSAAATRLDKHAWWRVQLANVQRSWMYGGYQATCIERVGLTRGTTVDVSTHRGIRTRTPGN
jgi:hypothetical protein